MRSDKRFIIVLSILGAIVVALAALYWRMGTINIFSIISGNSGRSEEYEGENYRAETTWDGTTETSDEVYRYPFDKGYGKYVTNIEYHRDLGNATEQAERIMRSTASGFTNALLGRGYRSLLENRSGYVDSIRRYMADSFQHRDADDVANEIADWIINTQYQAEINFATDHSLIWTDVYSYIRAEVTVTVYQGTDKEYAIADGFPFAEGGKYIIDFQMVYDSETDRFCVNGIECMAKVE